jgi:hypothetical protein
VSTTYTLPSETVTPRRFALVGCQDSDNTRVAGSKNWYVERGSKEAGEEAEVVVEVGEEEKRKSWRHPVEPATARRVGSWGEKWRSRIA